MDMTENEESVKLGQQHICEMMSTELVYIPKEKFGNIGQENINSVLLGGTKKTAPMDLTPHQAEYQPKKKQNKIAYWKHDNSNGNGILNSLLYALFQHHIGERLLFYINVGLTVTVI